MIADEFGDSITKLMIGSDYECDSEVVVHEFLEDLACNAILQVKKLWVHILRRKNAASESTREHIERIRFAL